MGRTQHRLRRSAGAQQGCQTQVADLDDTFRAIDEDVVTLEVAVDDGRVVAVQIYQAAQNLPCPPLQHLVVDDLVPLAVPAAIGGVPIRTLSQVMQPLRPLVEKMERCELGHPSRRCVCPDVICMCPLFQQLPNDSYIRYVGIVMGSRSPTGRGHRSIVIQPLSKRQGQSEGSSQKEGKLERRTGGGCQT